jgi:hypothetical protein
MRLEMEKFYVGEGPPRPVPKDSLNQAVFALLPNRGDEASRAFPLLPQEFSLAVRLARSGGYVIEEDLAGTTRTTVRLFADALQAGLELDDTLPDENRKRVEDLVAFCKTAGSSGWTLTRRWRRD